MSTTETSFSYPISFQIDILAYLLNNTDTFRKYYKYIKINYFSEFQLKDIYRISVEFFKKYDSVPKKASIINEINSMISAMNTNKCVQDYAETIDNIFKFNFNVEYVKDNIKNFIKIESVYTGIEKIKNCMNDSNKVLSIMEDSVRIIDQIDFDGGYNYKERIEERKDFLDREIRMESQVPILLAEIDDNTGGGLGGGELGCVLGRPGSGKSIFLCNIAVAAMLQGKNVIYYTMESNEELIASRIDHIVSKYTKDEMRRKKDKLLGAIMSLKGNLRIKEFPSGVTTAADLATYTNDLILSGFPPHLVIADYLGEMTATRGHRDTRIIIGRTAEELIANVAKKFDVPVWTAHQASDSDEGIDVEKEDPNKVLSMKDSAESKIALAAVLDYFISINQTASERAKKPQILRVFVIKNRLGPKHKRFRYLLDMDRFLIMESKIIQPI